MLINSPNISGSLNVSGNTVITGSLTTSIAALNSAASIFLTSDGGTIKSRTAAQTLSDIGAQATGSYVPYTGATKDVNLGAYSIATNGVLANQITVNPSGTTGAQVFLKHGSSFSLPSGFGSIGSANSNQFRLYQVSSEGVWKGANISLNSITSSTTRTYTLPDATGTFALTSNLTSFVTLDTTQTITGLKTILRSGDVLDFKIGVDTLYGLKIVYNQNELVDSGEATWSFVNTFNNGIGTGLTTTPISFFRGVLVIGQRLLSASVNANLLDYYGNNPSGRYPVYAYNTGVQQFATGVIVGETSGVVNAATGAISDLPAGVVGNFKGRVIGTNAVNNNEFVTLSQLTTSAGAYLPLTGGTITGSLTVTGDVIAQTLNVQEVTSSIVYSSGSNIFGNDVSNTQQFTGSVGVTGSLAVVGAGTFSSSVTSDDLILTAGTLFGTGNTGFSNRSSDTTLYLQMPATGFNITDNALNTRFILSSTGAITSQTTGNNGIINIGGSTYYSQLETNSTLGGLKIKSVWGAANSGIIQFINGTSENIRMHIADNGNIGIGNTEALEQLHLKDPNKNPSIRIDHAGGGSTFMKFQQFPGWNASMTFTSAFNYMGIDVTIPLVLNQNGSNVLIGTTTDNGAKLQVSGNVFLTDGANQHLKIQSSTGSYSYVFLKGGSNDGYLLQNFNGATDNGVSAGAMYVYMSNSQQFEFNWGGVSKIQFTSTGAATFSSNVGLSGDLTIGGNTTNFAGGAAYTKSNIDNVLSSGIISITTNGGGGGYAGFLIVSSTYLPNAGYSTYKTFSVLGRGTTATFSEIQALNGPSGTMSFTTSVPSNGQLTITNTSGLTAQIRMLFTGHSTA
jgi:hypothetical protein